MTELKIQKLYFSLLFFEHQYLAYYKGLTSKIFKTERKHSDVMDNVSDSLYRT